MKLMIPIASILILLLLTSPSSSLNSDGLSLLSLKAAIDSDPTASLISWSDSDPEPCQWPGIACTTGRVTSLSLPGLALSGYIPSELGLLDSLHILDLSHNNFSSLVPSHLFDATSLLSIDLSHNSLSGPIPPHIASLTGLINLDLSSNLLNASLPESLIHLSSLSGTLNLSYNLFSGEVPESYGSFPVTLNLDLRHNDLSGMIPQVGSLLNQGPTAFSGNPGLCGFPLSSPCPVAKIPGATVLPTVAGSKNLNSRAVPVISGVFAVVGAVLLSVWIMRRLGGGKTGKGDNEDVDCDNAEGQKGKFGVIGGEGFGLELEDLLRSTAYVVGKGRSGIVYRVVVPGRSSGAAVAVMRLSEGGDAWRLGEFESEVEGIGRVRHPNIVRLRAYYFASDEKLLVCDFVGNGSLYTALHGGPDSSQSPLSWSARLKIAQGIARGLTHIHEHKYVHCNLKSTKVLLSDDDLHHPYISGLGLSRLISSTPKFQSSATMSRVVSTSTSTYYVAPEARLPGSKFGQKCDVYSFGIVLMEMLTGRKPDAGLESGVRKVFGEQRALSEIIDPALVNQVRAKKQVVAAFHIALSCAEIEPELRPRMRTVSESLDRIK